MRTAGSGAGRPRSTAVRCLIACVATALLLLQPAGIGVTEAAWTDTEVGSGTFAPLTIPPPVMDSCVITSGALGLNPTITVRWRLPANPPYPLANVRIYLAAGTNPARTDVTSSVATTGPVGGVHTTIIGTSLLGSLLGGSYKIFLQTEEKPDVSGWRSTLALGTASMDALGANKQCIVGPNAAS